MNIDDIYVETTAASACASLKMMTSETTSDWMVFLKGIASTDAWPGSEGAPEEKLLAVETKLKVKLPPSYRAFLGASNGWSKASRSVPVLRPVERIRWFKREHRDWVEAYTTPMKGMDLPLPAERDYFNYASDDRGSFDTKHLAHTLCISEVGDDAVLLLNPMVVWPDGEWETWFFANWVPGAVRFRSFADWFCSEVAEQSNNTYEVDLTPGELPTVYLDGPVKASRRIRPREKVLTLDEVRKRLKSRTRSRRVNAVQCLCRMGGAEAVATLLDLLQNDYDFHVRCEAAESLGKMRAAVAIEPLMALTAEYSHITGSVVQALGCFTDEQSAQCLLKLIECNGHSAGVAVHALARRRDARAVKPLVDILLSKEPRAQHTGRIAGRFIAQFEQAGLVALEPLVNHVDKEIRHRAIIGISDIAGLSKDKGLKQKACNLLEKSWENEPEGTMKHWLATMVEVTCKKKLGLNDNPCSS